jgi:mannose-6-phosphate isomerase-like protein (cupin superfamily)
LSFTNANLLTILDQSTSTGPNWGHECDDLDCTFLVWRSGEEVKPHVNSEIDVVMVVLDGTGEVLVDGVAHPVGMGSVVVIPKNVERAIRVTSERLAYLNVHKRRKRLMPGSLSGRPARL